MLKLWTVLCALCCLGATYYVDPAGLPGNLGTESSPWDVPTAKAATSAGDTVVMLAGTYSVSVGDPSTTWMAQGPVVLAAQQNLSTGQTIAGFEITGGSKGVVMANSSSVLGCTIHDTAVPNNNGNNGVHVPPLRTNITIDGCTIYEVYRGIKLDNQNQTGVVITNNEIYGTYCDAVKGGATDVVFSFNYIHDSQPAGEGTCHRDGWDVEELTNAVVRGNTFTNYTQYMFLAPNKDLDQQIANVEIFENIFYQTAYLDSPDGTAPALFIPMKGKDNLGSNINIHHNIFAWTGQTGIVFKEQGGGVLEDITIKNNIFFQSGIGGPGGAITNLDSDYNTFYTDTDPPCAAPGVTDPCSDEAHSWPQEGPNSVFIESDDPLFHFYDYYTSEDFDWRIRVACGDINNDRVVNLSDAVIFMECFNLSGPFGSCSEQDFYGSDLNGTGNVDLVDWGIYQLYHLQPLGTTRVPDCG